MVKMSIGTGMDSGAPKAMRAKPEPAKNRPPVLVTTPALSGTGRIGAAMAVDPGAWSGTPAPALALQWQIGGADIPGATGASYTPVPADDLKGLRCVVTASNASGSVMAATAAIGVAWAPPAATGGLADQVFDLGGAVRTVDAAAAFAGGGLSFSVTGAGAMIDAATGLISIAVDQPWTDAPVTVIAANSGGAAAVTFSVTVRAVDVSVDVTSNTPTISNAGTLSATGKIGTNLNVSGFATTGAGVTLAYQWQRNAGAGWLDISGATGATHTPAETRDGESVRRKTTASNGAGSVEGFSTAAAITYNQPVAAGALVDPSFAFGESPAALNAATDFTVSGDADLSGITWSVTTGGARASIDGNGILTLDTASAVTNYSVVVRATNSGGFAESGFSYSVAADVAAPVLSNFSVTDTSDGAIGLTVDLDCTVYFWIGDPDTTPTDQEIRDGTGAAVSLSKAVTSATSSYSLTLPATLNDTYRVSVVGQVGAGALSNVLTDASVAIDTIPSVGDITRNGSDEIVINSLPTPITLALTRNGSGEIVIDEV